MKIYKAFLPKIILIFFFLIFIVTTIFGIILVGDRVFGFNLFGTDQPLWPMFIVWSFMLIFYFWILPNNIPFEIRVSDDNRIEFRGFRKTTVLFPQDIKSLHGYLYLQGLILLKHSKGDILLLSQMDNFHEFVSFLKNSNPNIEISGC